MFDKYSHPLKLPLLCLFLAICLSSITLAVDAQPSQTGTLDITTVDAETGAIVPNVEVRINQYNENGQSISFNRVNSGSDGRLVLPGTPDGDIYIDYSPSDGNYLGGLHPPVAQGQTPIPVRVNVGQTTVEVIRLVKAARIELTLTDRDNLPIHLVSVYRQSDASPNEVWMGSTDVNGVLYQNSLLPGIYRIGFGNSGQSAPRQYLGGASSFATAETIELIAGQTVTVAATIDRYSVLRGRVANISDVPIANARVEFMATIAGVSHFTVANSDGEYERIVEPGEYKIQVIPQIGTDSPSSYYPKELDVDNAEIVSVDLNSDRRFDVETFRYGIIQGNTVQGSDGTTPLEIGFIDAYPANDPNQGPAGSAFDANGNGQFRINYLRPGPYILYVQPADVDYIAEYYGNTSNYQDAISITVDYDDVIPVTVPLDRKGFINVTAYRPDGSKYNGTFRLSAFDADTAQIIDLPQSGTPTTELGPLSPDAYTFRYTVTDFQSGLYGGYFEGGNTIWSSKAITVARNETLEVPHQLRELGSLIGTVRQDGLPVSLGKVIIEAVDTETCHENFASNFEVRTNSSGIYGVQLVPGDYKVRYLRYAPLNGPVIATSVTHVVTVRAGQNTVLDLDLFPFSGLNRAADGAVPTHRDMQRVPLIDSGISGRVTDRFGQGIGFVAMLILDSEGFIVRTVLTSDNGANAGLYQATGLDDGEYYVLAYPGPPYAQTPFQEGLVDCQRDFFGGEYHPDTLNFETAETVTVSSGKVMASVDFTLEETGFRPKLPNFTPYYLPIVTH